MLAELEGFIFFIFWVVLFVVDHEKRPTAGGWGGAGVQGV
jgi:hypothetical protein